MLALEFERGRDRLRESPGELLDYIASGPTPLVVKQSANLFVDTTLTIPALPSSLSTKSTFKPMAHDMFVAEVERYEASDVATLHVEVNQRGVGAATQSFMALDLVEMPTSFTGTYKQLACGAEIRMNGMSGSLGKVHLFVDSAGSSTDQPVGHIDDLCPRASSSDADDKMKAIKLDLTVSGVPSGDLTAMIRAGGKAGMAELWSTGGPIGQMDLWTHISTKEPTTIRISASSLTLKASNWDIDGDTRFKGNPKSVYFDSGGATMGRLSFDITGEKSFFADTNGRVIFDKFNFRIPSVWPASAFDLHLQYAGCMKLLDDRMNANFHGGWGALGQPYIFVKEKEWGKC